jgi:hypothetical protein
MLRLRSTWLVPSVLLALCATACFEDPIPSTSSGGETDGDSGDGDGDPGDGDGDTGDGDGAPGDGDGEPGDMEPPQISSFTANGMATDVSFSTSTNVRLHVEASDDVGVTLVEFFDGDVAIGQRSEPPYELGWLVTSQEQGIHQLRAVASDASGKQAEATLEVSVSTEPGGQRLHYNVISGASPGSGIYGLAHGPDGSIYASGTHDGDIWIAKYGSNGITKFWDYSYGGQAGGQDVAYDVAVGRDGHPVFVGFEVADFGQQANRDVWMRKYSSNGDLWIDKRFDGGSDFNEHARGVTIGDGDRIYLAAERAMTASQFDNQALWMMSISPATGNLEWDAVEGGDADALIRLNAAATDPQGRIVVAGEHVKLQPFQVQAFTRVYAPGAGGELNEVWTRVQNGPDDLDLQPQSVGVGPDGSIVVAGFIEDDPAAWVRKYDAEGSTVWTQQYNIASGDEEVLGVAVDQNGYIALVGRANDPFSGWFVARYNPSGSSVWIETVQDPPYGDVARAVSIDPNSGKIVVGGTSSEADGGHRFIAIYAP